MTFRSLATAVKVAVTLAICAIILTAPHAAATAHPADTHVDNTDVMATYDCWSGAAPADMAGVIPAHALIDSDAGPVLVDSAIGFAIWGGKRSGVLIAFCR